MLSKKQVIISSFLLPLLFFAAIGFSGCSKKAEPLDNTLYFQGLVLENQGKTSEAREMFLKGFSRSDHDLARLCLLKLDLNQCLEALKNPLYKDDMDLQCRIAEFLYKSDSGDKYKKILNLIPEDFGAWEKDNELEMYRLLSLWQTGDTAAFLTETELWFSEKVFTSWHKKFLDEIPLDSLFSLTEELQNLIQLRLFVWEGNYSFAYRIASDNPEDFFGTCGIQALSDVGKAFLYGSPDKKTDAVRLEEIAALNEGSEVEAAFMAYFYAGRLLSKAGSGMNQRAQNNFAKAMKNAPAESNYDNALWYYLTTCLEKSEDAAVNSLKENAHTWSDPYYFDDFLDDLCGVLCENRKWDKIYEILTSCAAYMSEDSLQKYSYICGRLVQEKLIEGEPFIHLFADAAECRTRSFSNWYYHIMARRQLELPFESVDWPEKPAESAEKDEMLRNVLQNPESSLADKLASGALLYDLKNQLAETCTSFGGEFSKDVLLAILEKLDEYADKDRNFSGKAARLAISLVEPEKGVDSTVKYLFPRYFRNEIEEACASTDLFPWVMYALVRSESYFDAGVFSSAGAQGLCQLMSSTAEDIARKLRIKEYNLLEAQDSALLGAFYLKELVGRLDGSILDAAMSYNAGINRVRRWKQAYADLPPDLFIETVPYEETREYAKKILSGSVAYGALYFGMNPFETADLILNLNSR